MNSSYYQNLMTQYNENITNYNDILAKLRVEQKETEKLIKEINDSGIIEKLGTVLSDIEDTSLKLEQSSKYMSHIVISKNRTFDRGELAEVAKKMTEKTEEINALSQEIQNKLRELEESLKSTNNSITYYNDLLITEKNNYINAKKNYNATLAIEKQQGSELKSTIPVSTSSIPPTVTSPRPNNIANERTNKKMFTKID